MILRKLNITISLMLACSLAPVGFAYDASQSLSVSSWSPTTQFSTSSLGINPQYQQGKNWFSNSPTEQFPLSQLNTLDSGLNISNQWTVDIKHRLLSANKNTYLAMGLGWNDIEMVEDEITSGMRFVAEGRIGIYGPAYLFGQAALSPWMTNSGSDASPFGKELELGLAIKPLPSMSFRAGYRSYWLDSSDLTEEATSTNQADGFYLGGGLHW
jgi:hypothetical protein